MFTSLLSWVPFSVTGRYSMWYPVMLPLGSRGGVHDNSTLVEDRVNPLIECTCPGTAWCNGERLVSFATSNGICITNTLFPHKRIHQTMWYPPNPSAEPSLKDYVLVRHRLRSSILDACVCRGVDIDSDHRLVVLSIRLRLQRKVHRRQQKSFDA